MVSALAGAVGGAIGCVEPRTRGDGREVVDGLGRRVVLAGVPRRIVSLAPGVTESLIELGLADRLVGVTDFCRLPPGSGEVRRVGGILNPSLEAIGELRPDLLIGTTSGNDPSLASQAESLGLPLYVVDTPDVEGMLRALAEVAAVLDEKQRGEETVARLRRRLDAVRSRVVGLRPPRVLFIVWGEPLVVPGGPAYLTDALRRAGGISVTADAPQAWPAFDLESAIARDPEVILTTPQNRSMAQRLPQLRAWKGVPAVRAGRIHVVSEALQEPGPGIVAGIEEVARILHPEVFEGSDAGRPEGSLK
jgi:iron complex transport system substrate-binding protein